LNIHFIRSDGLPSRITGLNKVCSTMVSDLKFCQIGSCEMLPPPPPRIYPRQQALKHHQAARFFASNAKDKVAV
jgi:hypothetical protein